MKTDLSNRLKQYKKRYYINLILRGLIIALSIVLSAYLFIVFLEYRIQSGPVVRSFLFFGYILVCCIVFYKWLLIHALPLIIHKNQMSDERAATNIGNALPNVSDKLLNLVQLKKISVHSALLSEAIREKSSQLEIIPFASIIDLKDNVRFLKFLILPFLLVLVVGIFYPSVITEPSVRILHFRQDFAPDMPFSINIANSELLAFKNEDFPLELEISGKEIPESVFINIDNRRVMMEQKSPSKFSYTFGKMQQTTSFTFEAAGYNSSQYTITVVNRPNIKNFSILLSYPPYLNKPSDRIENTGDFQAPEGSKATWLVNTTDAEKIAFIFEDETREKGFDIVDNQLYTLEKNLYKSQGYSIEVLNQYSKNKDAIQYNIELIPDEAPSIKLEQLIDTTLYEYIVFGGTLTDDYGITEFDLYFKEIGSDVKNNKDFTRLPIQFDNSKNNQSFYYHWNLSEIDIKGGATIVYYLELKDNDGIHGRKSAKTPEYKLMVPADEIIRNELEKSSQQSENQLNRIVEDSKKLNEELNEIGNKFKGKKDLNWQDQKQIEELIERKEALDKAFKEIQENYKTDNQRRERLESEINPEMKEKLDLLQKLMDELLDEETKRLYQELQQLLEQQKKPEDIKNVLEKLSAKEKNFEKELERTLELFKKMKFELKLEQNIESTKSIQKKQESAAENKSNSQESKQKQQQEIKDAFNELKEDIKEMQNINQDLANPLPMEDLAPELKSIEKLQDEAKEQLDNNNNPKKAQQGASEELKKLSSKLESMQSQMMQNELKLNIGQLRDILDNLIKLSFQQEAIMNEFRDVNQSDPRFIELSQSQLRIMEDARVLQDSLISLAAKEPRVQSVVTRKVDEMNRFFDEAVNAMRERKKGDALAKQQFAMTTVNDLALMLDDVLSQMMNAMGAGGGKPQNARLPSMSELQEQLSEKIQQLKQSGKEGRELSEELARLAAEQEMIRQMLSDLEKDMGNSGSGEKLKELMKEMEQSEVDLVNKQLTNQLIQRQKEIVTRLLEAENSDIERELDEQRESEQAREKKHSLPPAFEEYFLSKEKEIELLITIPPKLNEYYKKEVNQYFKRIE